MSFVFGAFSRTCCGITEDLVRGCEMCQNRALLCQPSQEACVGFAGQGSLTTGPSCTVCGEGLHSLLFFQRPLLRPPPFLVPLPQP